MDNGGLDNDFLSFLWKLIENEHAVIKLESVCHFHYWILNQLYVRIRCLWFGVCCGDGSSWDLSGTKTICLEFMHVDSSWSEKWNDDKIWSTWNLDSISGLSSNRFPSSVVGFIIVLSGKGNLFCAIHYYFEIGWSVNEFLVIPVKAWGVSIELSLNCSL